MSSNVTTILPAPEGWIVDIENPTRAGVPDAYYIAGFGTALSLLFFGQRMYTKIFLSGGLQSDDVLLIFAMMASYATMGLSLHMFISGVGGIHGWEFPLEKLPKFMLDVYLAAFLYPTGGALAKLSLLVFYLKLSPQYWFRMAVWATIAIIVGYTIGINVPLIFACKPISMSWDPTVTGKCISRPSLYIAVAVTNIISDVIIFVLPIPTVVKLQIPRRQKIGLIGIFGIGSLTIITSIVRLTILPQMLNSQDQTWLVALATIWTLIEGNLMLICASLPTLRKFFKHIAPKLIGESRYGSKSRTTDPSKPNTRTLVPSSQSRRDRHQYSQFDSGDIVGTDTYIMGPVHGRDHLKTIGGGEQTSGWADSDSEKAIIHETGNKTILQTTTVTVDVEQRSSSEDPPLKKKPTTKFT